MNLSNEQVAYIAERVAEITRRQINENLQIFVTVPNRATSGQFDFMFGVMSSPRMGASNPEPKTTVIIK